MCGVYVFSVSLESHCINKNLFKQYLFADSTAKDELGI